MTDDLAAIYRRVPAVLCKGLCAHSCGPIAATRPEVDRLEQHGPIPTPADPVTCPLLENDRCSRYADRPLICRLYGATDTLRCPHGCVPFRYLTDQEAGELIRKAEHLAGGEIVAIHPTAGALMPRRSG